MKVIDGSVHLVLTLWQNWFHKTILCLKSKVLKDLEGSLLQVGLNWWKQARLGTHEFIPTPVGNPRHRLSWEGSEEPVLSDDSILDPTRCRLRQLRCDTHTMISVHQLNFDNFGVSHSEPKQALRKKTDQNKALLQGKIPQQYHYLCIVWVPQNGVILMTPKI